MTNIAKTLLFVCLTTASALAGASNTSTDSDQYRVAVDVADLNLGHPAGLEALYKRLQSASREVCGDPSISIAGSARYSKQIRACYDSALTGAVEELDLPELRALHNS